MDSTTENAYGKLNLALDVLGKRPDGYHEMRMVMQAVEFSDELTVSLNREGRFTASADLRYIPGDDRNIALKAVKAFIGRLGEKELGADIFIKKRIPVCAGMGGGSSDGAAALRALNRLTGRPFSREDLLEIAGTLGSDVAFCVAGGTALARGRGEELTEVPPLPDCALVICKPRFSVSTPKLFSRLDRCRCKLRPDIKGMVEALEREDLRGTAQRMFNVFEEALSNFKDIEIIKRSLVDLGALGSVMTGTGSAVFGVFEDEETANAARDALRANYEETVVTKPKGTLEI